MHLVGLESLLLCLVLVIPCAIFAQAAGLFSERVHEFPQLFLPLYNPYIKVGTGIPFITVSFNQLLNQEPYLPTRSSVVYGHSIDSLLPPVLVASFEKTLVAGGKSRLFEVRKERVGEEFLNSDGFAAIVCDGCGVTCQTDLR